MENNYLEKMLQSCYRKSEYLNGVRSFHATHITSDLDLINLARKGSAMGDK